MVHFGHVQRFDERSRDYTIADTLLRAGHTGIHDQRWNAHGLRLKQPPMACTGYSRTIDLRADPAPVTRALGAPLDDQFARTLYRVAQRFDARPGENYQGASVLGALKACKALGLIGEYRWAFNIDDALSALTHIGGLVAGTNWYRSMLRPRPSGLLDVDPSSGVFDGHAYYVQGLLVSPGAKWRFLATRPVPREPLVVVLNSLGHGWGRDGFAAIRVSDFETLLEDRGACSINTTAFHEGGDR